MMSTCKWTRQRIRVATRLAPGSHVPREDSQHRTSLVAPLILWRGLLPVDIIHADYFSSVDVNDLLIEQVPFQQEQTFRAVGCRPLCRSCGSSHGALYCRNRGKRQPAVSGL